MKLGLEAAWTTCCAVLRHLWPCLDQGHDYGIWSSVRLSCSMLQRRPKRSDHHPLLVSSVLVVRKNGAHDAGLNALNTEDFRQAARGVHLLHGIMAHRLATTFARGDARHIVNLALRTQAAADGLLNGQAPIADVAPLARGQRGMATTLRHFESGSASAPSNSKQRQRAAL